MTIFATTFQGIACKLYEVLGIDAQKYVTICQVMNLTKKDVMDLDGSIKRSENDRLYTYR